MLPVLPHRFERAARGSRSTEAMHQVGGVIGVPADPEFEHDLTLLSVGEVEWNLDRAAGIESRPHLAGKPRSGHGGRILESAVAAQEFGAVAAHRPNGIVHVEEGDPATKFGIVLIAREEGAASGVNFRDHVHRAFRPQISEHPFDVSGSRKPADAAGVVSYFQYSELDRSVGSHIHRHLRGDTVLGALEDAVTESVPADVGGGAAVGQRRGRPEVAALFVTDKAGFSTGIADWIIIPRGKPHLVGIFDPGVSEAALRDDGSEVPVRQHIYPRRRLARAR